MINPPSSRPLITLSILTHEVCHNGLKTRVVLSDGLISVGCTDITIESAKYLVDQYDQYIRNKKDYVLQT